MIGAFSTSRFIARFPDRAVCLLLLWGCLGGVRPAGAQVQMELKLSRRTYILYEPVIATVNITNLAGRDIVFEDVPGKQWFNVEITTLDGDLLPPLEPDYKLHPLTIRAGETLRRQIDLSPLFPIRQQGQHRVRANVYQADANRYFFSNLAAFELTDGKLFWRQTVGVPGSSDLRQLSLLTNQLPDKLLLYVRIRDEAGSTVYTTQQLGRMILGGSDPQEMLDRENNLHVLQEAMPGAYLYTEVGLDGSRLTQKVYNKAASGHPFLAKSEAGEVMVRNGQIQVAPAKGVGGAGGGAPPPKLSDRPSGMPTAHKDNSTQ